MKRICHHRIPNDITVTGSWQISKIALFQIYEQGRKECLFAAKIHSGVSGDEPLGRKPGVVLYNGATRKDAVIAAAGFESQWDSRAYSFESDCIVMVPLYEDHGKWLTLKMSGVIASSDIKFVIHFKVEMEDKPVREKFEWHKVKEHRSKPDGFELFRMASKASTPESGTTDQPGERVASLVWAKKLSNRYLRLEFHGSMKDEGLGEQCSLMAIISALQLYYLRLKGKTTAASIRAKE